MRSLLAAITARTRVWYALLITRELDELIQIVAAQRFENVPEVAHVCVPLHQAYLVHGVRLQASTAMSTNKQ